MHRHDDRERPVARRLEQEDRNRFAVEALEAVQRRLDELRRLEGVRTSSDPNRLPVIDVIDVDVARRDRAREGEG